MNNTICLLCYKVREGWCTFLNKFKNYDIYIIIDCNNQPIQEYRKKYKNINFIKIIDFDCVKNGFYNSVHELWVNPTNKVISWDKGLYFFSKINKNYQNVWFMEDDIFFYDENTLLNLDNKNKNIDLVIKNFNHKKNIYNINEWHWKKIIRFKDKNWEKMATYTMVCCVRLSRKYLNHLIKYVEKNNKLHLIETLIPTLAIVNKLNIKYEKNLRISWRKKFKYINKFSIYHPIKNFKIQNKIRYKMKKIYNLYINEQYNHL